MHGDLTLNGWLIYVIYALGIITILAAAAIAGDAYRRPQERFGRFGKAPWMVVQLLYLGLAIFGMIVTLGPALAATLGLLAIVAFVQQIAYLLRVVYPSPKRLSAMSGSD